MLWVGLVRLFFLWVETQERAWGAGEVWAGVLFETRVLGRARLPTLMVAISLLLLLYLWLDYRSRPFRRGQSAVFLLAALLLVYLGWAVWRFWWSRLEEIPAPPGMLMTALPAAVAGAG